MQFSVMPSVTFESDLTPLLKIVPERNNNSDDRANKKKG